MGYLVETIHVELSDKGREVTVLEPPGEDIMGDTFVVKDYGSVQNEYHRDRVEYAGYSPKKESPFSDQRIRLSVAESVTILYGD